MLTLITCTSDRPQAFALCEQWMSRAIVRYKQPVEWIVIDDGIKPVHCTLNQTHIRREPSESPTQSFLGNLTAGLHVATGEKILFIEDDDWYHPDYLTVYANRLDRAEIVGEARAKYYSVQDRRWEIMSNDRHASLAQTGIRAIIVPQLLKIIESADSPFVDMPLWEVGASKELAAETTHCIGIKGLPGKVGFTTGHSGFKQLENADPAGDVLAAWVSDYEKYLPFSELCKSAAIVVTCKGRLHHLRQTLPSMLAQTYARFEIVVVDYGCPDGTADWIESLADSRVRAVRVENNTDEFCVSRARNIGIRAARAEWCISCDADVSMPPDYLSRMMRNARRNNWELCCVATDGNINGQCLVSKQAWETVRGYDEEFRGCCYEDVDFYSRIERAGIAWGKLEDCGLSLIQHADDESTRFHAESDKVKSTAENGKRMQDVGRVINPDGWGTP